MTKNEKHFDGEDAATGAAEMRVRESLRALPKVGAPSDFGFRVKARIAAAAPSSAPRRWRPAFALPFAGLLVALAAVFFVLSRNAAPNADDVARSATPAANATAAPSTAPETAAPAPDSNSTALVPPASPASASPRGPRVAPTPSADPKVRDDAPGGGSVDLSSRSDRPRLPDGFGGTPLPPRAPSAATYQVREALESLGIEADFAAGRWTVRRVRQETVGDISGVRAGDVVEAFDDLKLDGETVTATGFGGKTLTVARAGARIRLALRTVRQ